MIRIENELYIKKRSKGYSPSDRAHGNSLHITILRPFYDQHN